MKRPAFQFYPADWRNDPALRMCSLAARGLWWEMICVMHTCEPYGHLLAAGKAIEPEELGRIVGESARDVRKWLGELERHAIFSRTEGGVIFSRRMVRDEKERDGWRDRKGKSRAKSDNVTELVTVDVTPKSQRSSSSTSSSPSKNSSLRSERAREFWLPDWIPKDAWEAFVAMRSKIKKPLMELAKTRVLNKLEKLRAAGHDPGAVLEQSVFHCWQDVFEIKPNGANGHAAPAAIVLALETDDQIWDRKVGDFKRTGDKLWRSQDGAQPGNPDCMVPRGILEKHGYEAGRRA